MGVRTAIAVETSCGVIKSDHWLHWGVVHNLANRCSLCQDGEDDDDDDDVNDDGNPDYEDVPVSNDDDDGCDDPRIPC